MFLILLNSATWLGLALGMAIAITFAILWSCSKEDVKSTLRYEFKEALLTQKESDFLMLLNEYRQSKGLCVLKADAFASDLAYIHNLDMISYKITSHTGYPERQMELIKNGALKVGEIVGYGYSGIQGAYSAFIASDSHLKVIKGDYNAVGVDITPGDKDYYTILFIKI